jgi:hypothetical protein
LKLIIFPGFENTTLGIDLRKFNQSHYTWGETEAAKLDIIGWEKPPNSEGKCGAYSMRSVILKDCQSLARVLCMNE